MHPAATANSVKEPLEQRRAKKAHNAVVDAREKLGNERHEYTTVAQNLPVMILQNGLGQCTAFLMAKAQGEAESPHGKLLDTLAQWLVDERGILDKPRAELAKTERLMAALLMATCTRDRWLRAHEEAVALAVWIKRFAEALILKPKSGQGDVRRKNHGQAEAAGSTGTPK